MLEKCRNMSIFDEKGRWARCESWWTMCDLQLSIHMTNSDTWMKKEAHGVRVSRGSKSIDVVFPMGSMKTKVLNNSLAASSTSLLLGAVACGYVVPDHASGRH